MFRPEVWYNIKPEDYVETKSRIADRLITDLEKATGTNIRDHIEEIEIATPITCARYTRSHNGIVYGYELESWDSVLTRFMSMFNDIYLEGLEFCGGFWRRGHGYSSTLVSGNLAAAMTLAKLKKGGNGNE